MDKSFVEMVEQMGRQEKAFAQLYRNLAKDFGLSECGMWVLYFLSIADSVVTQHDLAEKLLFPKQTIHSAVKKLASEGLLSLTTDPQNRLRKKLELTNEGQHFVDQTVTKLIQAESSAISQMGEEKMAQYVALQGQYLAAMTQAFEENGLLKKETSHDW